MRRKATERRSNGATKTLPGMVLVVLGAICVAPARGQSGGNYDLTWYTIDGGGVTYTSAADYELGGTMGQPDAGVHSGGDYTLTGGFWVAAGCGACQLYGDVFPTGGNCVIDVDDILCVLDGFSGIAPCDGLVDIFPCGGSGVIDVDDILAELDAFAGIYACPDPCPP